MSGFYDYAIYCCCYSRATLGVTLTLQRSNIVAGGKHCCSYYSRQGDRWKFEKSS